MTHLLFIGLFAVELTAVVPYMLPSPLHRLRVFFLQQQGLLVVLPHLDHVMHYLRYMLHWLPLSRHIEFRFSVWVWPVGSPPVYLQEFCCSNSGLIAHIIFYVLRRICDYLFTHFEDSSMISDLPAVLTRDSACTSYKHLEPVLYSWSLAEISWEWIILEGHYKSSR